MAEQLRFERVVARTFPWLLSFSYMLENRIDPAENVRRNLQAGWRDYYPSLESSQCKPT